MVNELRRVRPLFERAEVCHPRRRSCGGREGFRNFCRSRARSIVAPFLSSDTSEARATAITSSWAPQSGPRARGSCASARLKRRTPASKDSSSRPSRILPAPRAHVMSSSSERGRPLSQLALARRRCGKRGGGHLSSSVAAPGVTAAGTARKVDSRSQPGWRRVTLSSLVASPFPPPAS